MDIFPLFINERFSNYYVQILINQQVVGMGWDKNVTEEEE